YPSFFFFFQAEDGIRDGHVTGVQTCALPISRDFGRRWLMEGLTFKPYATGTMNQPYIDCALRLAKKGFAAEDVAEALCETAEGRSEERRVGKEWRCRWARDH